MHFRDDFTHFGMDLELQNTVKIILKFPNRRSFKRLSWTPHSKFIENQIFTKKSKPDCFISRFSLQFDRNYFRPEGQMVLPDRIKNTKISEDF